MVYYKTTNIVMKREYLILYQTNKIDYLQEIRCTWDVAGDVGFLLL